MLEIGKSYLVAVVAGYNPYVFAGRIKSLYGPYGFVLENVAWILYTGGNEYTWPMLASGDESARGSMRVRMYTGDVIVGGNLSYATEWVGTLPAADQN